MHYRATVHAEEGVLAVPVDLQVQHVAPMQDAQGKVSR